MAKKEEVAVNAEPVEQKGYVLAKNCGYLENRRHVFYAAGTKFPEGDPRVSKLMALGAQFE